MRRRRICVCENEREKEMQEGKRKTRKKIKEVGRRGLKMAQPQSTEDCTPCVSYPPFLWHA
jgi:hypothetical protein